MKHAPTLRPAALAFVVLMAFAGQASATTLTSPSGTTFTGTEHSISGHIVWSGPFGDVTCLDSTIHTQTETHGAGVTAAGKIKTLTFGSCKGGSITSPVAKPGTLEVHGTSTTGNGTLTSSGAEIIIHNTLVGTCTYSTATATDIGTLTGSNVTKGNAVFDISGVLVRTGGSGFCGESATWKGSYKVTSPAALEVH